MRLINVMRPNSEVRLTTRVYGRQVDVKEMNMYLVLEQLVEKEREEIHKEIVSMIE